MSRLTLKEVSCAMRRIDICMLTTRESSGRLHARPMSNNSEVEYDGDSYFFTYDDKPVAREIEADPSVNLGLVHRPLLCKSLYLSIEGRASLVRDRAEMKKRWHKHLNMWFKQGLDTPGLVMIRVKAEKITYWHGYQEGEITL